MALVPIPLAYPAELLPAMVVTRLPLSLDIRRILLLEKSAIIILPLLSNAIPPGFLNSAYVPSPSRNDCTPYDPAIVVTM